MNGQNPIFIPGPTNIPDPLRRAMDIQPMDHRSSEFVGILGALLEDLKKIFRTIDGQAMILPSSGTGGWEAAITNTLSPGDKVLAASYGSFSDRWIDLCRRHRLDVEVIECEWGTGAPADLFEARLKEDADQDIKAILVTQNETATGVKSDIAAVRRAMDSSNHPAMLYVDCVSSLASYDFRMDDWGVDVAVCGSQKGFMLTTGTAILGISQKALEATKTAKCPRAYFDFQEMAGANAKGSFPYTPPMQIINGLRFSVDMLLDEGLENVFARHHRIAEGVREAVRAWGLELCARSPEFYSDTVSAIYVPEGFNSDELTNHLFDKYNVSFGIGLGRVAGRAFRIGHLGAMTDVMTLSGIAVVEMAMVDLGYPVELGSGTRAAQEYYRRTANPA